jgi:hypothetical protein
LKPKIFLILAMLMLLFYNSTAKEKPNPFGKYDTPVIEQTKPEGAGETAAGDSLVTYYRGGMSISGTKTNIDSGSTTYTGWFDVTAFDGQTMYLTTMYVCDSTTADTMLVITEGRDGRIQTLTLPMDTTTIVGSSGTVTQTTITLSSYFPECRLKFLSYSTNESDDAYIKWSIYSLVVDTIPPKLNLGNY